MLTNALKKRKKEDGSSLPELPVETSEGSYCVNSLRMAAVLICVCNKENIDDKE